jgi:AraC-like DNA-binding protein
LGFSDAAYFSRFFSNRAGMSPTIYRETHDRGRDTN